MKKSSSFNRTMICVLIVIFFISLCVHAQQGRGREGLDSAKPPQQAALAAKPFEERTRKYYVGTYPNGEACPNGYKYDEKNDICNLIL